MGLALAKIHPPAPRRGQLLARPALEACVREALSAHRLVPSPPRQAMAWCRLHGLDAEAARAARTAGWTA